jgi:hypothetical protein
LRPIVADQPAQGTNFGFIAQQVQQLFPELVSTTSATTPTPGGTLTLNYAGLIAPIVKAMQALAGEVSNLEHTVAGFADNLVSAHITVTTLDAAYVHSQEDDTHADQGRGEADRRQHRSVAGAPREGRSR